MTTEKPMDIKKFDRMVHNPVHLHEGVWWFWDETWSNRIGSYIDKVGAQKGLEDYREELNIKETVTVCEFSVPPEKKEFDINQCNCAYMVAGAQCAYCREFNDS